MRLNRTFTILILALVFVNSAAAQRANVTITLNEQFFDTLIDAIFQNASPPEFSIAKVADLSPLAAYNSSAFVPTSEKSLNEVDPSCSNAIRLLREMNGVRTAVRFREGKILAPLAFSGGYSPPFVGCVDFAGWAETNIELVFDQGNQRLLARVSVANVSLDGTGGVGGTVIAKLIQSAIDKKVNPVELMKLDKISFTVPIQNAGSLKMKAVGVRNLITNGALNVNVTYEFLKG